jgi:hypothetical protein
MKYDKTTPCDNCPFRSDKPFPLAPGRVLEIEQSLVRGDFPCHKTTVETEDEQGFSEREATDKSQHCAGALILLEKLQSPSQMMRICERIGLYDARKLDMSAPVYDSWEEMEIGCGRRRRNKAANH